MIHQLLDSPIYRRFEDAVAGLDAIIVYDFNDSQDEQIFFTVTHHYAIFDFAYEAAAVIKEFVRIPAVAEQIEFHIRDLVARVMRNEFNGTIMHMLYSAENMPVDDAAISITVMLDTRALVPNFALEIGMSYGVKRTADLKHHALKFVKQEAMVLKEHADLYFSEHRIA